MAFALKDLKANESRLKDINKVAEDLESEGLMADEVQAVQQASPAGSSRAPSCVLLSPTRCPERGGARVWSGALRPHSIYLLSSPCAHFLLWKLFTVYMVLN